MHVPTIQLWVWTSNTKNTVIQPYEMIPTSLNSKKRSSDGHLDDANGTKRFQHSIDVSMDSAQRMPLLLADAWGEKGVRKTMEDEHLICQSLCHLNPNLPAKLDMSVYGIFDGHGGRQSAVFAKDQLPSELCCQLMLLPEDTPIPLSDRSIRQVLKATYKKIDSRIATELPSCKDGSTAILALRHGSNVFVASLGDSAAFLAKNKGNDLHAIPLMEVHKPWVITEKDRIVKAGGTVENGRVNGSLEVSRSFGDLPLKRFGVLCTPTLMKISIQTSDEFILLGCDGFWSCWSALDVITLTRDLIEKEFRRLSVEEADISSFDVKSLCKKLVEYVIVDKKSQDNVSVMLILLHPGIGGTTVISN